MNLWIRSQDKKLLIPINNALYIPQSRTGENFGIFYKDIMLGYYTKEERALEVLNEIELALGCKRTAFNNTIVFVNVLENVNSMVYEMPEE